MTAAEKDRLVDGKDIGKLNDEFKQKKHQLFSPENVVLTPKRRYEDTEDDIREVENEDFQMVEKRNRKKTRQTRQLLNTDEQGAEKDAPNQVLYQGHQGQQGHQERKINERKNNSGRSMIVFNSYTQRGKKINETKKAEEKFNEVNGHYYAKNNFPQHVLNYAVNHQIPPIKIHCQPEVKDHFEGTQLIGALLSYIQEDFKKLNKSYTRPMGFDTWYVDKQGSLLCFTREIELFVYLWDISHYPSKLLNTTITPIPPVHLPPQYSIIFKFVPNSISFEELSESIADVCQSKHLLEEMKGSITNKSRHIRLDITSKDEMKKILNGGVFPLGGHLLEVTEFLAPPQVLICSRCNCPGHVRKECKGPFDRCRRCGLNKAQGDHKECTIKCHHCEGVHLSTDYRCPVIVKYRGELIDELRRRPELLPIDVQLFIPVEFRNGGKNFINSARVNSNVPPTPTCLSQLNAWPTINHSSITTTQGSWQSHNKHEDILNEINMLKNDYEKLKLDFDRREKELINKHENYKNKIGTMLNLLVLQNNQQNDCITKVYTVVNEVVPIVTDSLKAVHVLIEKIVKYTDDLNMKSEFNNFQVVIEQNLSSLNDRNDLVIEHQRATSMLMEKTNALFRQGIELLSLNEQ
jgi:hypothetical protein